MENSYQEALVLFNSGDFEGAFALLKDIDSDPQAKILKYKCLANIEKQYSTLIEDAGKHGRKDDQDLLYQDYVRKYGENTLLENLMGLNHKSSPEVAKTNAPKVIEVEKNYTFSELLSKYQSVTVIMVSLAAAIIILIGSWGAYFYNKAKLEEQLSAQKALYQEKEHEVNALNKTIEEYAKESPIIVKSIKVKNKNLDYGAKIYSSKTSYITAQLECLVLKSYKEKIDIKLHLPSHLSSYSEIVDFQKNYDFETSTHEFGWGWEEPGHWPLGKYKLEFFIKGKKIGSTSFTIY